MAVFKKGMTGANGSELKPVGSITQDTKIIGSVEAHGDIRIDGELEGTVECKGLAVIGPKAKIKGTIRGNKIEVWGYVEGKIFAEGLLSLRNGSKINGDILAKKLSIEPGANFMGNCKMMEDEKPTPQSTEKNEVFLTSKPEMVTEN